MLHTGRAEKVDEKNGVILSKLHVPFLSYGPLTVQKKCIFWKFCVDLSEKSKSIHLKGLVMHFQKIILLIIL